MNSTAFTLNADLLQELTPFGQPGSVIHSFITGILQLRKHSLHELKGYFTQSELIGIVLCQGRMLLQPEYQCSKGILLALLKDSEQLENTISSNGTDPVLLYAKIESLTSAQVYFLELEIFQFINQASPGNYADEERALIEFVNQFL